MAPKIKDLLRLLKEVTAGIKDAEKVNQSIQSLGNSNKKFKPLINLLAAQRRGIPAGQLADVIRENARIVANNQTAQNPPLLSRGGGTSNAVRTTTRRVLGYEKMVSDMTKQINDKGFLASFPGYYAERLDSYADKVQRMIKDVTNNADLKVNREGLIDIRRDIGNSYNKVQSIVRRMSEQGLLDNGKLTESQRSEAQILEAQLEIEIRNIDLISKNVKKATRMSESVADMAERKREQYNRAIDKSFNNIYNMGRAFAAKDVFGVISSGYDAVKGGIKVGSKLKSSAASFEGSAALYKQLGGLAKAMGPLALLKIFLESMKLLVSGARYFSDKAADLNRELSESHGLASQGIPMGIDVSYDQIQTSMQHYRKLYMDFGADTKTWVKPDQLMAISSAMEPYGKRLYEFAGDQETFNSNMLGILGLSLEGAIAAPEMAGMVAEFSQQFGTDLAGSSAFMDVFIKSAKEADIPARFLIEGIRTANADMSVAGTSIIWSMELQKKALNNGRTNLKAGQQGMEAYLNAVENLGGVDIARLRDQLGGNFLAEEAGRKIESVKKQIASGVYKDDDLRRLQREQARLEQFLTLDSSAQSYSFKSTVGTQGVSNLIRAAFKEKFPEHLKALSEGKTLDPAVEQEMRVLMGQTGVSVADWDRVASGLSDAFAAGDQFNADKALKDIEDAHNKAQKGAKEKGGQLANYMAQQAKLSDILESVYNKYLRKILEVADRILASLRNHFLLKMFGGGESPAERQERAYNALLDQILTVGQMEAGANRDKAVAGLSGLLAEFKVAGGDFQKLYEEMQAKGIPSDILQKIKGAYEKAVADYSKVTGTGAYSAESLAAALDQAGISDPTERAAFLAQMAHESGNFKFRSEQISDEEAERKYGYQSRQNKVGGLGNTAAGDGAKYKGRGYVQLAGKWNYGHYGKMIGVDLINNPELAEDPRIAAQIAIAYWNDRVKKKAGVKDFTNVEAVTSGINPGLAGLSDRKNKFKQYQNSALTNYRAPGQTEPTPPTPPTPPATPPSPKGRPSNAAGTPPATPPGKGPKKAPPKKKGTNKKRIKRVTGDKLTQNPTKHLINANSLTPFN